MKSSLLIIDKIGYTPIDRKEANLFFSLISVMYELSSVIITSNKSFDQWSEIIGYEIMTTTMLDRLLHLAHVYSLEGNSYIIKEKNGSIVFFFKVGKLICHDVWKTASNHIHNIYQKTGVKNRIQLVNLLKSRF